MSLRNVELQTLAIHIGNPQYHFKTGRNVPLPKAGVLTCPGISIFGDAVDGEKGTVTIFPPHSDSKQPTTPSLFVKGNTIMKGDSQSDYGLSVSGGKKTQLFVDGDAIFTVGTGGVKLSTRFGTADAKGKIFDMSHPSRDGYRLRYACIEGPEIAVYCRGRLNTGTEIQLPSYWKDLVYENSITVQITPIGTQQDIIVKEYDNEKVILESSSSIDCFYTICAERKDVNPLITEYEGEQKDYPDPNWNLDMFDKNRDLHDPKYATSQNVITK